MFNQENQITMLVSIEKKNFIKKEYKQNLGVESEYDLVMYLLDDSLFEQGDIKEMIEVCQHVYQEFYNKMHKKESLIGYSVDELVTEAHNDWVENNYSYL